MFSKPTKSGFTLVELLVVITIIGLLAGISIPAVQQIRETARRTECLNNLRQIGVATKLFYQSNRAYPPARYEPGWNPTPTTASGGDEPSWLVRILPFVEQESFFQQWDVNTPYTEHSQETVNQPVDVFCCPSRRSVDTALVPSANLGGRETLPCGCGGAATIRVVGGASGDYAGNHGDPSPGSVGGPNDFWRGGNGNGVIISSRAASDGPKARPRTWIDRIRDRDIADGTSHTTLAGEIHIPEGGVNQMPWNGPMFNGEDLAASARVAGPTVPLLAPHQQPAAIFGFGSAHPEVVNFVFADGSTRGLSFQLDTITLGQISNRADGATPGVLD